MSDSKPDSGDQDRPRRDERSGSAPRGSRTGSGNGRPAGDRDAKRSYSRDGKKRPQGDRDQKPPYKRDGEKRPYQRDGEKRLYGDRDQKRPYSGDRSEKRPYSGDRGEKRPYQRDGEKRPYSGDRSEKRPYQRDGEKRPYGDRDQKRPYSSDRSEKRPYSGDRSEKRPYQRDGEKRPYSGGDRNAKRPHADRRDGARHGGRPDGREIRHEESRESHAAANLAVRPRHDDPEIPERIEARDLDRGARAELKTLSRENADWVARHLVAASELLDDDPEAAHQHAVSAARRAGRIAVVRETLAITAYATGDFPLALRELRTYRRISGSNDQLPLMVDSERGVGRPDRALEVGRAVDRAELPAAVQVALAIAMSGARLDLGQPELALAELEIPQLDPDRAFSYSPPLFAAYAEVLEELGRDPEAAAWRARADRAVEALAGPAESELVEIFEVEVDAEESVAPDAATETGDEPNEPGELTSDPGDVLEDDVAAVLAEGESDDAEGTTAETHEDTSDGAVPHED